MASGVRNAGGAILRSMGGLLARRQEFNLHVKYFEYIQFDLKILPASERYGV